MAPAAKTMTVSEIADRLDGRGCGDGSRIISGVANLRDATTGDISFVGGAQYADEAANTKASAVIVDEHWDRPCAGVLIRVPDPEAAFEQVVAWFAPPPVEYAPGIHATAVIADDVQIGAAVHIGPYCVIEPGAIIGARTTIVAQCYIGHRVKIGDDCRIYARVGVREDVRIGKRVIIHTGAVIGSDGFGFTVNERGEGEKIPQRGTVVIEDDVEIGANTTIDRARFSATKIGRGVKIDNLVQIGHNVVIEEHVGIVSQVGISGSCRIGAGSMLYGQAGLAGHLEIGRGAVVGAQAGVTKDVPARTYVSGYPAAPHVKAAKLQAHIARLPLLKRKVRELEARLEALEKAGK